MGPESCMYVASIGSMILTCTMVDKLGVDNNNIKGISADGIKVSNVAMKGSLIRDI